MKNLILLLLFVTITIYEPKGSGFTAIKFINPEYTVEGSALTITRGMHSTIYKVPFKIESFNREE